MEDLDLAGGVPAVMKVLLEGKLVSGAPITVTGQTVAENLAPVKVLDPEVIRLLSNPYTPKAASPSSRVTWPPKAG